jgi:transcriptional regulator with XRE-family HTH domain
MGTMERDSDASFLGAELRRARLAAGFTSQEALAGRLGFDRTVIAKVESGLRPPSPDVAEAYAREFPDLNALIQSGLIERWAEHVKKNGGSFPKFFIDWVDEEQAAMALFYWAPMLVPGILQTEKYARALLEVEPDNEESLEARLSGRMQRQQILSRPKPPMVTALLDESVLWRCIGNAQVMNEQLLHLAEVSYHPKVVLQVIPAEVRAHAGLSGAVSIADRESRPTIVYLESLTAGRTSADPDIIAKVRTITDVLRGEALTNAASRDLIMKVAEEQWT